MEVNDTLFGVTDQFVIIPMRISDIEDVDSEGIAKIVTEMVGDFDRHMEVHHGAYFKSFIEYVNKDRPHNTFGDINSAIDHAQKLIASKRSNLTAELRTLSERETHLESMRVHNDTT